MVVLTWGRFDGGQFDCGRFDGGQFDCGRFDLRPILLEIKYWRQQLRLAKFGNARLYYNLTFK